MVACSARVMRCPEPGESLEATGFIMEAGGKGFNVALAAHRLGVPVDGAFAVGDDPAGHFMQKAFADLGLDASVILTVDAATGAGVGLIQADGENRIAVYPGANAQLSADHVHAKADRLQDAGLIYAQFEAPDAPIAAAFAQARDVGIPTMLNPSPYRSISQEILAATDIMVVNEQEAVALCTDLLWTGSYHGLAAILSSSGVATLIVTCGSRGALAWHRGTPIKQDGFAVEVVDSIGAGDAFNGALIAALVRKEGLRTALRWGCAAGALSVTRLGVAQSLPNLLELRSLFSPEREAS